MAIGKVNKSSAFVILSLVVVVVVLHFYAEVGIALNLFLNFEQK